MNDIGEMITAVKNCFELRMEECNIDTCPYSGNFCRMNLKNNVVAQLKMRQPEHVKSIVLRIPIDDYKSTDCDAYEYEKLYACPNCKVRLARYRPDENIKYCYNCGQAVIWDE